MVRFQGTGVLHLPSNKVNQRRRQLSRRIELCDGGGDFACQSSFDHRHKRSLCAWVQARETKVDQSQLWIEDVVLPLGDLCWCNCWT